MIRRSMDFDLGNDRTRMKDPKDAQRQHATVDVLLDRFFDASAKRRREIQILSDEVGMGKTFVALGVAYSVLDWMRRAAALGDLHGCYRKVVVITPQNPALFVKWQREVGEFVKRCVPDSAAGGISGFAPATADRIDELVSKLRKPASASRVIVTNMGVFTGKNVVDHDFKRRMVLRQLFRLWGTRLRLDARDRLVGDVWGGDATTFDDPEYKVTPPVGSGDISMSLQRIAARADHEAGADLEKALERCQDIAAPYRRDRRSQYQHELAPLLMRIYKSVCAESIRQAVPLVIVDEAHNWKNGPKGNTNGFREFTRFIARNSRRTLLLTATPFQLRPDEMLEILKISDYMVPAPTEQTSEERRNALRMLREQTVRPILRASAQSSIDFQRAWTRLAPSISTETLLHEWNLEPLVRARHDLTLHARKEGPGMESRVSEIAKQAVADIDPSRRAFFREALRLFCYNADLSLELGGLVIRHKRSSNHRLFLVGREQHRAQDRAQVLSRPDSHLLHFAHGLDVKGEAELPHYLLMRCVSEMKRGNGRSSLGSALTGCYSTLLHSAEGKQVQSQLRSPAGAAYLDLLMDMVGEDQDPRHPKVEEVVHAVMDAWHSGEKSLIFCFRVNTAQRLRTIIDERIRAELTAHRKRRGDEWMRGLRTRLTGRDRDLITLGLDRVLWSYYWARDPDTAPPFDPDDLLLTQEDLRELVELALRYGIDLMDERVDRVFLHRATEYVVARRLLKGATSDTVWTRLLEDVAKHDERWVSHPYGDDHDGSGMSDGEDDAPDVMSSRGVQTVYSTRQQPKTDAVEVALRAVLERRQRAERNRQLSIFDQYARGPSLWFGAEPTAADAPGRGTTLRQLHGTMRQLTTPTDRSVRLDWPSRRVVLAAMRRALLRESVLLRLLPDDHGDDDGLGPVLATAFFTPMRGQQECMADRIGVFLEDLASASGDFTDTSSARYGILDATKLRDVQTVALASGNTSNRGRMFSGFNSPLLPEVLICTSVGQEGIDLHRHCRHVIHYDLAWNPAVLEQRTGRADRIGSKTFRERTLGVSETRQVHLEIGVPFLAGTYDERMYEELRLRAQTFEVLTGGDFAVENAEGEDEEGGGGGQRVGGVVLLPSAMLEDLRVRLHVWSEATTVSHKAAR